MRRIFLQFIFGFTMLALLNASGVASAAVTPPPSSEPTTVQECKQGGWKNFGELFKNQGDCVSFVVTGGRNLPSGPALH